MARHEKEKAFQYLEEVGKKSFHPRWLLRLMKYDPLLDSIREEERFQLLLRDMEATNFKEQNRVRLLLEEESLRSYMGR